MRNKISSWRFLVDKDIRQVMFIGEIKMEYLFFFIILGGIAAIVKNPVAFIGIFVAMIYTFGFGVMFALGAEYLNAPEAVIVLSGLIGFFASIVLLAYAKDIVNFFKTKETVS